MIFVSFIRTILFGIKNIFAKPLTKNEEEIINKRSENFRRVFHIENEKQNGKCVCCRICMSVCPCDAIDIVDENVCDFKKERCAYCGLCEKMCPMNAIKFTNK